MFFGKQLPIIQNAELPLDYPETHFLLSAIS